MHPARGPRIAQRRSKRTLGILAVCSLLWLFGLNDMSLSSLQLLLILVIGLFVLVFAGVMRRRADNAPDRTLRDLGTLPQTYVVLRRFGADAPRR